MAWLNFHHFLYYWTVAREGGVAAASRRLRLSRSSISTQLRQLAEQLGQPLFDRSRGRLQLTEAERTAFRIADELFGLGRAQGVRTGRRQPVRGGRVASPRDPE